MLLRIRQRAPRRARPCCSAPTTPMRSAVCRSRAMRARSEIACGRTCWACTSRTSAHHGAVPGPVRPGDRRAQPRWHRLRPHPLLRTRPVRLARPRARLHLSARHDGARGAARRRLSVTMHQSCLGARWSWDMPMQHRLNAQSRRTGMRPACVHSKQLAWMHCVRQSVAADRA